MFGHTHKDNWGNCCKLSMSPTRVILSIYIQLDLLQTATTIQLRRKYKPLKRTKYYKTAFNKETSKKGFHFFRKDCWAAHHNHRSSGNLDTAEQDEFGVNLLKELGGKRGKEKMGEFFSLPCVAPASQARGQFASVGEIWHFFCILTKKSSV